MRRTSPPRALGALLLAICFLTPAALAQGVFELGDGGLIVEGTSLDDVIVLVPNKVDRRVFEVRVIVNGVDYGSYSMDDRPGLTIRGRAGDDLIKASRLHNRVFPLDTNPSFELTITGDAGDDKLLGSRIRDVIYGHDGDDVIRGGNSDDILLGGDGDDRINGGRGHDVIEGQAGDYDVLVGACGNDKIADKDGAKRVDGGDGLDKLLLFWREGWGSDRRRTPKPRVEGGYDADYMELTNHSAADLTLIIDGDEFHGYDDDDDRALFFGWFAEDMPITKVESVTYF